MRVDRRQCNFISFLCFFFPPSCALRVIPTYLFSSLVFAMTRVILSQNGRLFGGVRIIFRLVPYHLGINNPLCHFLHLKCKSKSTLCFVFLIFY